MVGVCDAWVKWAEGTGAGQVRYGAQRAAATNRRWAAASRNRLQATADWRTTEQQYNHHNQLQQHEEDYQHSAHSGSSSLTRSVSPSSMAAVSALFGAASALAGAEGSAVERLADLLKESSQQVGRTARPRRRPRAPSRRATSPLLRPLLAVPGSKGYDHGSIALAGASTVDTRGAPLNAHPAASAAPQVVSMLRQQLAATTSQLDGVKKERDDARQQAEQLRHLEAEIKVGSAGVGSGGGGGPLWAWCAWA